MELYNLFSVPVLRYAADESYDDIQCEVKMHCQNMTTSKDHMIL